MLLVALPSLLVSFIVSLFNIIEMSYDEFDGYTSFGRVTNAMPDIGRLITFPAAVLALIFWRKLQISTRLIYIGWTLSLILSVWPTVIPADVLVKDKFKSTSFQDAAIIIRVLYGLQYLIRILPLILTLPFGSIKGSLRTRGLLPYSSLAGFIVVLIAPSLSILMVAAMMLLIQIAGNGLLIASATCLTLNPLLDLVNHRLYTNATSEVDEKRLDQAQRITGLTSLLRIILMAAWAFTYDKNNLVIIGNKEATQSDEALVLIGYSEGAQIIFQSIGFNLFTTILVADRVLHLSVENWQNTMQRQKIYLDADRINNELHRVLVGKDFSTEFKDDDEKQSSEGDAATMQNATMTHDVESVVST
jgi:hypothetical protein